MSEPKSFHHKGENRYKFESFTDRIASINVDVVRRLPQPNDVLDEDGDSYFVAGLEKWRDLNCTQDFVNFSKEVSRNIRNYKQLVHYEEECMALLKKHLQVKPSLAYVPLLDLVVQLARDLQQDMYPHFKDFFLIIVGLLDTQDTEVLEGAFQTLGYLFKFLWRYLVKDVESVYELYSSLLVATKTEHILRFAAESFAFLLRKVKSQDEFFDFILNDVSDKPEKVAGVGRLFFEMLKGVRRQLHSCAPKVLHLLFSKLRPQKSKSPKEGYEVSCDVVHDCLQAMLQCICKYISEETATLVWQCLLDDATSVHVDLEGISKKKMKEELRQQLMYMVRLVKTFVKHGQGKLVGNPKQLYQFELTLLASTSLTETYHQEALDLLSTFLLCKHSFLNMEQATSLTSSVFTTQYTNHQVLSFCQTVTPMPDFEAIVLPKLLEFVHVQMLSDQTSSDTKELILFTLVELIKEKSPITDFSETTSCEKYCLDFSILVEKMKIESKKRGRKSTKVRSGEIFPDFLLTLIEGYLEGEEDINKLYGAITCLPSVRPLNKAKCTGLLMKLITDLEDSAKTSVEKEDATLYLYMLSCCVQAYCHCSETSDVKALESTILKLLSSCSTSEYILLAADCVFSKLVSASIPLNVDGMLHVFPLLQENLTSHSSKVRLLTLQILVHIPVTLPKLSDSPKEHCSVLQLCLNAEKVPLTLDTYREKLMQLRKLEYNTVSSSLPVDRDMTQVAVRYLVSMLHANLQLFWEPVIDLIKSYALGMDIAIFWSVYHPILKQAAEAISKLQPYADKRRSINTPQQLKAGNLQESFKNSLQMMYQTADRPDLINFRNLLWRTMAVFPEKVEAKTRDLVPMVLHFVEHEYNISETVVAPSQDISKKSTNADEDEQEEEDADVNVQRKGSHSKTSLQKSLVVHLQLFRKFRNPKSAFQEAKMRELFFCLLSSPHAAVQKVALDCVMTYKFKYLLPYSEQFTALMNDKTFTDALLLFNLDEESGLIEEHHREGLLPVLFRVLYGKMLSRSGAGPQGKSGLGFRRSLILRFLGGSKEAEMKIFLDLVFEPFLKNFEVGNCSGMLKASLDALNPSQVVPLKKQHSILESCSVLLSRVGHLVGSYNSAILHVLIMVAGSYNALLDRRDELLPHAVKQLKTLRQKAINCLEQFFDIYDQYPFTSGEVDSLFDAVVWPQLEKLPSEGLAGPTPLLKLFCCWSKLSRFHILLAKHHPNNESVYAIPSCISLLSSTLSAPPVVAMVMEIIYNLLNIEDEESGEDFSLVVNDVIAKSKVQVAGKQVQASFGVSLIQPYIPAILSYVRTAVKPRKVRSELPLKEISLLSKLSGYIDDPTLSASLISLLLPHLEKTKEKHENIEVDILNTIKNLVVYVDDSHQFNNKLSKCFQRLTSRNSRTVLCDVISAMATKIASMEEAGRYVQDMNAWDKKRLDEPDYTRRLASFKQLNQKVLKMTGDINTVFYSFMLDNCFFFVLRMDEMSMRDSSSYFLISFIKQISGMKDSKGTAENLILSKYLPALKEGVKARKESVRHECITILSEVVRYFPNLEVFKTLTVLHNSDKEKDFFENIRHIQVHRRVRALRTLSRHCKEGQLEVKGVRHFLLPIATAIVFDPDLGTKHENVVLEAVECVGAIARLMPWGTYFALLKQFLRLLLKSLDQQKIAVRLLVTVLEAFHFDLSSSEYIYQDEPEVMEDEVITGVEENTEERKEEKGDDGAEEETVENEEPSGDEKALGTKIHRTIVNSILPKLLEILTERTRQDGLHKSLRDNAADDSEILRVPLAVAMVKLVKRLPNNALEKHLPRIVLKVCNILKHRVMNVRDIARDSLIKILATVGVSHFNSILHQMSGCLTRGYQVHVLGYSLYALIKSIPNLNTGNLDKSMEQIIKILNEEIFGDISEEKEVAAIVSKLPEAKGTKSFDCYELIGKVIGEGSLTALILPLKEILDTTHSHKVVNKVREVLRRVALGLSSNKGLTIESMMIFVHGLASDTLPLVTSFEKTKAAIAAPHDPRLPPPSVYLLPPKPKRWGESAQTGRKTNMHVLMEFGLLLLQNSLKSSKLAANNQFHLSLLDPFVDILSRALSAKANVVINVAVRCLTNVLRFPLPSLQTSIEEITKSLFQLLKRHAGAGVTKGENLELVTNTFKAVTVLVRDFKHHKINEKQLQVLLAYCEEDIHDYTRQATAFTLLSAILSRKLLVPEIHGVMNKVRQLAITSETGFIRQQCRQVDLKYLLDYPLGKKVKTALEFYVSQLSYEMESGRKSALDMLTSIFNTFPQQLLQAYAGLFFVPMSISLVNDESTACRRLTAAALKVLLCKLDIKKRNELFVIVKQWLEDEEVAHQRLAVQLCGIFVAADGNDFQLKVDFLFQVLEEKIRPENWQLSEEDVPPSDEAEKETDHLLFHLLSCLLKVLKTCSIIKSDQHEPILNKIWNSVEEHLLHPHAWIRITTAQLYGELFAAWPHHTLVAALETVDMKQQEPTVNLSNAYIVVNGRSKIKILTTKFCGQLLSSNLKMEHCSQIVKNLVYLGKVMHRVYPLEKAEFERVRRNIRSDELKVGNNDVITRCHLERTEEEMSGGEESSQGREGLQDDQGDDEEIMMGKDKDKRDGAISISWMVRKLCWICANEVIRTPKETIKRTSVIKWFAALTLDMNPDDVKVCLPPIIKVLVREIDDYSRHKDDSLKVLCQEVLELLKGTVGLEYFTQTYAEVQRDRQELKQQRKRQRALEAVADPEEAAKRKMKKNLLKKEAKKRKLQKRRPTYMLAKKMKTALE